MKGWVLVSALSLSGSLAWSDGPSNHAPSIEGPPAPTFYVWPGAPVLRKLEPAESRNVTLPGARPSKPRVAAPAPPPVPAHRTFISSAPPLTGSAPLVATPPAVSLLVPSRPPDLTPAPARTFIPSPPPASCAAPIVAAAPNVSLAPAINTPSLIAPAPRSFVPSTLPPAASTPAVMVAPPVSLTASIHTPDEVVAPARPFRAFSPRPLLLKMDGPHLPVQAPAVAVALSIQAPAIVLVPSRPLHSGASSAPLPSDLTLESAVYCQKKIGQWTLDSARALLGEPVRQRPALDDNGAKNGEIFAFPDPTNRYRELELDFDQDHGTLRTIFVYPWDLSWQDCKRLWGSNFTAAEANKGRKFYSYLNRRLDVLVAPTGKVISLGLY